MAEFTTESVEGWRCSLAVLLRLIETQKAVAVLPRPSVSIFWSWAPLQPDCRGWKDSYTFQKWWRNVHESNVKKVSTAHKPEAAIFFILYFPESGLRVRVSSLQQLPAGSTLFFVLFFHRSCKHTKFQHKQCTTNKSIFNYCCSQDGKKSPTLVIWTYSNSLAIEASYVQPRWSIV